MKKYSRRSFLKGAAIGATSLAAAGMVGCAPARTSAETSKAEVSFTPGTYYGIGQGRGGAISAEVTLSDTAIEKIQIFDQSETPIISDAPLSWIPQQIVKHQSLAVDTVTHATMTSMGTMDAIANALKSSGCDTAKLRNSFKPDPVSLPALDTADIAIVGGGCCGMTAAVRAAQLGVPVVLIEQSAHLGGDALFCEGWTLGAGTLMQKAAGIEDSGEKCWQDILDNVNNESTLWYDEDLSYRIQMNSGRTIDWLDQYVGARFDSRELTNGTYGGGKGFTKRIHFHNGGLNLIKPLVNKVNEGIRDGLITVVYQSEVTRILTDESGAVSGIEMKDSQGGVTEHPFKAVLLATGGFHQNREMVEKYLGSNFLSGGGSTSTGSGFTLCEDLGLELTNMSGLTLAYAGGIPSRMGVNFSISHSAEAEYPGVIWVDIHGKRSYDETANQQISHTAWKKAEQQTMNIVFPASAKLAYRGLILRDGDQDIPFTPTESWAFFDELLERGEYVFEADTPEELAEKLGIDDPAAFKATIDEINACVESGQPDSLGRASFPRFEGKLYGVKTFSILHNTYGGVKRNSDLQPIDANGSAKEGLYAAGELCGIGMVTPPTSVNVLGGGSGVGGSTNQGRIAIETMINKLMDIPTELEPYVFEGSPDSYDSDVYDAGDYIGTQLVFKP